MPSAFPAALTVAAAASVVFHLRAERHGTRWQVYLFKPTTTALLVVVAALANSAHGARYQQAVVLGLACSLVGDALLMLPGDRFVPGLASFLVAHLAYLVAFSTGVPLDTAPGLAFPLAVAGFLLLRLLWPGLGRLRVPVVLYAATILLMLWRAWARRWTLPSPGATLAAAGATLFVLSDAILALNRFRRPVPSAQTLIMGTYVAAQALIAWSVGIP